MEIRDKDLKELARVLRSKSHVGHGVCPDEEALAAFAEGNLPEAEREDVVRHVIGCVACRDAMSAATAPLPEKMKVPRRLLRRAAELVPLQEPPWEIVVRLVSDAIEVIRNTGERTRYFTPAYASVRGRGQPVKPSFAQGSLVAFTRKMGGLETEVELERVAPGISEIKVTMKDHKGAPPRDVRVNLHSGEKELMSYTLAEGCAIFDKVKFGNYVVDFTRRGLPIGEIALDIRGE